MLVPALTGEQQLPLILLILMPVLYAVLCFIATLIGAWIFNLVPVRIGGFEFTKVDMAERS